MTTGETSQDLKSNIRYVDFKVIPIKRKRNRITLGTRLRRQGFDETTYDRSTGYWRPRCSCCEAMVIQGMACHETGCSNIVRDDDD